MSDEFELLKIKKSDLRFLKKKQKSITNKIAFNRSSIKMITKKYDADFKELEQELQELKKMIKATGK